MAFWKKTLTGFVPACSDAEEQLNRCKLDEVVQFDAKRTRNLEMHRKFWVLMNLVYNNQEGYESKEMLVAAVKLALGHCDTFQMKNGMTGFIPKSISFAKMDQPAFHEFYEKTLDLVATKFLPGVEKEALRKEVEEFLYA